MFLSFLTLGLAVMPASAEVFLLAEQLPGSGHPAAPWIEIGPDESAAQETRERATSGESFAKWLGMVGVLVLLMRSYRRG